MKNVIFFLVLSLSSTIIVAQDNWFTLYTDSTALANDANKIAAKFINDVKKIDPKINFDVKTIVNTTPYLIYYSDSKTTVNLPLWDKVIPEQKNFFYDVAGDEINGKNAFGYFFNGFYLPHELGHALQGIVNGNLEPSYQNEYFANTVAILWWRKNGNKKDLKNCYESAKMIWNKLPNPIPAGSTMEDYFTKNYEEAGENPYIYGYMQFKQFILIYEDKNLPDFDTFIGNYINEK